MSGRRQRRTRRGLRLAFWTLVILATTGVTAWWSCGFQGCPDLSPLGAFRAEGAPALLDRDGNEFARLHPRETLVVPLDAFPRHLPDAFLAVEDRRFYSHRGVDWPRVLTAAVRNVSAGRIQEGASTLTMQLARTLFPERLPGQERTFRRKLLEIRNAQRLESRFSKEEILELYLNHVYLGGGTYGVEAAARYYFDRPAAALTVDEVAFLAGATRAPAHYDPRRHPERARGRRDLVLSLMERQGRIGGTTLHEARSRELTPVAEPPAQAATGDAPYFVEAVRAFLEGELGEALYRDPIRVHTTLDPAVQRASEAELVRQLEALDAGVLGGLTPLPAGSEDGAAGPEPLQGAVAVIEPETGQVLALVGGREFRTSPFNRATLARRPMGSAYKPFVFAAALEAGYVPSQPLADRPMTLLQAGSGPWAPRNYDGDFRGPVTMRQALVESLNVPTVRLALAVGLEQVGVTAEGAGIPGPIDPDPASALGTSSASPLELAAAYATLAAGGWRTAPRTVLRVEDPEGRTLYEAPDDGRQVMDPRVAYLITDILRDAVNEGTGRAVREVGYSGPVAGKTGTTQGGQDAWFVGYTPDAVGAIWLGYDRPRAIFPGATGGRLAAPVWGRIMSRVYSDRPAPPGAPRPAGLVEHRVDAATGRAISPECGPAEEEYQELFLGEHLPGASCPESPGVMGRVVGFFRGLVGGSDDSPGETDPSEADVPADTLRVDAPPGELLGAERVPLGS